MSLSSLLVAFSALNAAVLAAPAGQVAQHVIDLHRTGSSPPSSKALVLDQTTKSTALKSVEEGSAYGVPITYGGQKFTVIFDTGSSDLWLPTSQFQCLNAKGKSAPGQCGFESHYTGGFNGGVIPDENFNITYGDGEFVVGKVGYNAVELAGLTVKKQESGLVNKGYFLAGGDVSGLIGFAYPFLTSAYHGTNPAQDNIAKNQAPYNPFFFTAIARKLINPIFTLTLGRGKNAGQLSLGGVPASAANKKFASTPIQKLAVNPNIPDSGKNYSYYIITPKGVSLAGKTAKTTFPVIVDSGTTLMYLPNQLAIDINNAFDPPSQYVESEGVFENDCNAKPPSLAFNIGGMNFNVSPQDLLLTSAAGRDPSTGGCLTGVQPGGTSGPFILGDTFLRNVVAVFDIGNEEIRFAQQ